MRKSDLPSKDCIVCGRPFSWRKKWERDWPSVKFCSAACSRQSGSATRPTDRLFFAAFPDQSAREIMLDAARDVATRHGLRGRVVGAERLHVTLAFLGDHSCLPRAVVEAAQRVADAVRVAPFRIAFDRIASLPAATGAAACVLLADDAGTHLARLHAALAVDVDATASHDYLPHVTLLRDRRIIQPEAVEPIGWSVDEFALVHSLLGTSDSRILGRWRLRES